ncbi:MAG TPA: hypothetical protein VNO52_01450 [Methylomirabilota bacterium]|nr:hypothetical protein [Methylomirabilota bacterium]
MRNASFKLAPIATATLLALGGCVPLTPNLDARFGEAVELARAQQTLNPDASNNTDPVKGMDGKAAKSTMDRYHESFKEPPPPVNVFTIGVGGGSGR